MEVSEFLGLLKGVKAVGKDRWMALCPAHNDRVPSLSVTALPDKILVSCQAGCHIDAVLTALKIKMSDLFLGSSKAKASTLDELGEIVATYDYLDENGKLLHQTVRFEPKEFRQRRLDKNGKWIWNLRGIKPVIYHLPQVKEAIQKGETIFLPEGEKDADNLTSHFGVVATTIPMGAGKWRDRYAQMLNGAKEVIVIADNDAPGQHHAQAEATSLLAVKVPTKLLEMPSADIKDISDWISAGLTADQLKDVIDALPPYAPSPTPIEAPQVEVTKSMFRLTDLGNAERLVQQFGDILRYSYERKLWLIWNGKFWEWDMGSKVMQLATYTVRSIYREAADEPDDKKRKELADHAKRSENNQRLEAMIKQAAARPFISINMEELNGDAFLLNCNNGTINLKAGNLQPHDKRDFITVIIPLDYDPGAKSGEWVNFLATIFERNESLISYVQKALGYSMTGSQAEQAFFFCHGGGWNGKSTLLGVVSDILGDYAQEIDPEAFMVKKYGSKSGPNEPIADLYKKRMVCSTEVEEGQKLSVARIKRMTGGESERHERKWEHGFNFTPSHKLWLSGNHEPRISDTTNSFWYRLKRVPFKVSFSGQDRIKDYRHILSGGHGGAILAWLVEGCIQWQKHGLGEPPEVLEAIKTYREEQDILLPFLTESCIREASAIIEQSELYKFYKGWCNDTSAYCIGSGFFRERLKEKGFTPTKGAGNKAIWVGIRLKTEEEKVTLVTSVTDFSQSFPHEKNYKKDVSERITEITKITEVTEVTEDTPDYPHERCPACGGEEFYLTKDGRYLCSHCRPESREIDMEV